MAATVSDAANLDRLARMDGYRVRLAKDGRQQSAWHGALAVFKGECFVFSASNPDRVRAWLYDQAMRGTLS